MVGLGWVTNGAKIEVSGCVSLLQKSARESGEVNLVEIEILAIIIIMQVNGYLHICMQFVQCEELQMDWSSVLKKTLSLAP